MVERTLAGGRLPPPRPPSELPTRRTGAGCLPRRRRRCTNSVQVVALALVAGTAVARTCLAGWRTSLLACIGPASSQTRPQWCGRRPAAPHGAQPRGAALRVVADRGGALGRRAQDDPPGIEGEAAGSAEEKGGGRPKPRQPAWPESLPEVFTWEFWTRRTLVEVTPWTTAGALILLVSYTLLLSRMVENQMARAEAEAAGEDLPTLTLRSGVYMQELKDKYGVTDSEVLDAEVGAMAVLEGRQQ
uniref:Uncharacterized protein n=1 Tax=Alexandrium catenella TaxID=2925 RepID=A0A7S1WIV6_ALECA